MSGRLLRFPFVLSALMSMLVTSGELCGGRSDKGSCGFGFGLIPRYLAWVNRPLTSALMEASHARASQALDFALIASIIDIDKTRKEINNTSTVNYSFTRQDRGR
jgi:hypothetical protein